MFMPKVEEDETTTTEKAKDRGSYINWSLPSL